MDVEFVLLLELNLFAIHFYIVSERDVRYNDCYIYYV